jgi:plasmid stabilization system protein ParE
MEPSDDPILERLGLDDEHREFVAQEVAEGRFPSVADYLSNLVCCEKRNRHKQFVARLIEEGIESGPSIAAWKEYWAEAIPGFVPHDLLANADESWPVSCRPKVAEDMASLVGEIAPIDAKAAAKFVRTVATQIAEIGRKPGRGFGVPYMEKLFMHPVGRTPARIAYICTLKDAVDVVRILHRDKHGVLKNTIDSSLD